MISPVDPDSTGEDKIPVARRDHTEYYLAFAAFEQSDTVLGYDLPIVVIPPRPEDSVARYYERSRSTHAFSPPFACCIRAQNARADRDAHAFAARVDSLQLVAIGFYPIPQIFDTVCGQALGFSPSPPFSIPLPPKIW